MKHDNLVSLSIDNVANLVDQHGGFYGSLTIPLPISPAVTIPFAVNSAGSGPLVVLLAGIHGNEWNSVACVTRIAECLKEEALLGRVICLPVINISAFLGRSRVSCSDQVDMNRAFNVSSEKQVPSTGIASAIWENIIKHSDYVVDLHSAGDGDLISQVRVCNRRLIELGRQFLMDYVQVYDDLPEGFLIKACDENGLRAFGLELGQGLTLQEDVIEKGARGVINFLKAIGVIPGRTVAGHPKVVTPGMKVKADQGGLFWPSVAPGQTVKQGDSCGEIEILDLWSRKPILAGIEGVVLYVHRKGAAAPLDTLVEIVGGEHELRNPTL